jgi:FlaA1/EpsC-like NDP-sugar epimerase
MTVGEAVALVLRGGALAEAGDILSLDMGAPLRILDLAEQVLWQMGHTMTQGDAILPQDIGVVFTGLRPGEKLHEEPPHFGGTRSAAHPMLFVCQDQPPSQLEVAVALRALTQAISDGDDDTARHIALQWATTNNKGNKAGVGAAM